jgi:hypothetical protein
MYHSVKWLLGLSNMTLKTIMEENDRVWDEIPEHLLRLKRENPGIVLDEDTPPERAIVIAIKFLKQNHLPGSLLGRWQMPLPDIEVFHSPVMIPWSKKLRVRAKGVVHIGGTGVAAASGSSNSV